MANPNDTSALVSLILGIVAFIFVFTGNWAFLGMILAAIGIFVGIDAHKKNPSAMATAGIVLGVISLVACALTMLACVACMGCIGGTLFLL